MSSFTWIRLRVYQSPSFVNPVAVVITLRMLAPSLPGPRTFPAQTMPTCATISTNGSPVPAPPAPSDTSATNLDAQQPTRARTTMICPTQDPSQSQLVTLAIPPEAVPDYLSKLSPSTPINIPQLSSYLHDHPDHACVNNLLMGLTQKFRIGFQGPRTPKEYSNLLSARDNPSIISKNILKEVQLGHTAGPFISPLFPTSRCILLGLFQRNTPPIGVQFFTYHIPNITPQVSTPTSAPVTIHRIILQLTLPSRSSRNLVRGVLCLS